MPGAPPTSSSLSRRAVLNCLTPRPLEVLSNSCAASKAWKRPASRRVLSLINDVAIGEADKWCISTRSKVQDRCRGLHACQAHIKQQELPFILIIHSEGSMDSRLSAHDDMTGYQVSLLEAKSLQRRKLT